MTDEVEECRKIISARNNGSTHYDGCWRVHGWCIAEKLWGLLESHEAVLRAVTSPAARVGQELRWK